MYIVERILRVVAPHYCLGCDMEGSVVCAWCLPDFVQSLPSRCFLCQAATQDSAVCKKCRRTCRLAHVWVCTAYDSPAKIIIHRLKFDRVRAAAEPIAELLAQTLPYLPPETIVTHVPTATSRIRKRGYDQAQLIARHVAKRTGLPYRVLLVRTTQTRQVGATREQRHKQMKDAFRVIDVNAVARAPILLVDDLTTTGATLQAAAVCLRQAGAKKVNAAVFAQKK